MESGLVPQGNPFQVNTTPEDLSGMITNAVSTSSIIGMKDGGYLVVWSIVGVDGDRMGVFGQRFDAQNSPIGTEFQINTYITNDQKLPRVAVLADGSFVVVWEASYHGGFYAGIIGQRYDVTGTAVGGEFVVNTETSGGMYEPDITALDGGGFVVVWQANILNVATGLGVKAQVFDANGNKVGAEITGNSVGFYGNEQYGQNEISVISTADGGFLMSWSSLYDDAGVQKYGIFVRKFDAFGVAVNPEFQVNTVDTLWRGDSEIVELADGSFVVVWASNATLAGKSGIYAQRVAADGSLIGTEFVVNGAASQQRGAPQVIATDDGGFVVAWNVPTSSAGPHGIYLHRFDADGVSIGTDFYEGTGGTPSLEYGIHGEILLTWSTNGIYAQVFEGRLFGTQSGDIMSDTVGTDWMNGRDGDDTLYGLDGDDVIFGGAGGDFISGDIGNDQLDGGLGDDLIYGKLGKDTIYGGAGNDTIYGGVGNDYIKGNDGDDKIFGGGKNDVIFGGAGNDILKGGKGDDEIHGGAGSDRLKGNLGNDTLYGDAGDDFLFGLAGQDILIGGAGSDVLWGGAGADTFVFNAITDSSPLSHDWIRDFELGIDQIDLSALSPDTFVYLGSSNFSGAGPEVRSYDNGTSTILILDVDGDGVADMKIFMNGSIAIGEADFIL